jgi:hypothetical protein
LRCGHLVFTNATPDVLQSVFACLPTGRYMLYG